MKEFIIKNFLKHKAVIILMVDESGRMKKHWAIPGKDNTVKLIATNEAVVLSNEAMLLTGKHNIPTFVVRYNQCEAIDLTDVNKGVYGAAEFSLILDNDMAEKVFKSSNKQKLSDDTKIIIAVVLLGIVALGYFMNTKFEDLRSLIEPTPIVEVVEGVGTDE